MKNKKNILITLFLLVSTLSFLSSSASAPSYADMATKGISDYTKKLSDYIKTNNYTNSVWKTIQNNPEATMAGLAVAGLLLYSANLYRNMAALRKVNKNAADEQQKRQQKLEQNNQQVKGIEEQYKTLLTILNSNQFLHIVLDTIDTNKKPIMKQLEGIDFRYGLEGRWLTSLQAVLQSNFNFNPKLYTTQLQGYIRALNNQLTASPSLSKETQALITLRKKLLLIDKLVEEQQKQREEEQQQRERLWGLDLPWYDQDVEKKAGDWSSAETEARKLLEQRKEIKRIFSTEID